MTAIDTLVTAFESGRLSRRQLVQGLAAMVAASAPAAVEAQTPAIPALSLVNSPPTCKTIPVVSGLAASAVSAAASNVPNGRPARKSPISSKTNTSPECRVLMSSAMNYLVYTCLKNFR